MAGYLAFVGGYVNSTGFVLIGAFTSHVTGNVGRLSNDIVTGQFAAAATVSIMLVTFFGGAFVASMILESDFFGRGPNRYAAALSAESVLLLLFTATSTITPVGHPRLSDLEAAILCASMGIQNSLVTRLSGAVVRTTHLTGVFTDLGIEAARWFRWWRATLTTRFGVKLAFGVTPAEAPSGPKTELLVTIAVAFLIGAAAGAATASRLRHAAMFVPCIATGALALYAFLHKSETLKPRK